MKTQFPNQSRLGLLLAVLLAAFSCSKKDDPALVLQTVTTSQLTAITSSTASSGGNVTANSNVQVSARGVCWSTTQNPTITDNHTTDGTGAGAFTSAITGLTSATIYYVRAYATSGLGTVYGEQLILNSLAVLPTVTTATITNITVNSASSGGQVTSDGGSPVTALGVCWSTSQNPTVADSHTTDGSGTGAFLSSISGLTQGTTYYVRAYATNGIGTAYGNQQTMTSLVPVLPTVTTADITNIGVIAAKSGGQVTADGNSAVTTLGVCWSTSQNPTVADSHTTDGSGTGAFFSSITNLSPGTLYYVRAYATNSVGTSYGVQKSFTTAALSFNNLTRGDIVSQEGFMSHNNIPIYDNNGPILSIGTILLYKTKTGRYGKLEILQYTEISPGTGIYNVTIGGTTFAADGTTYNTSNSLVILSTWVADLDNYTVTTQGDLKVNPLAAYSIEFIPYDPSSLFLVY